MGENLDELLDEALEDFLNASKPSSKPSNEESCCEGKDTRSPDSGSKPLSTASERKLVFDPLSGKRGSSTGAQRGRNPQKTSQDTGPGVSVDGDSSENALDELSEGLQRLFAELAQAADRSEMLDEGEAREASLNHAPSDGLHQGLSATLQRLAANAPEFPTTVAENRDEDFLNPEVLQKLLSQLEGLDTNEAEEASPAADVASLPGMASFVDGIMQQLLSKEVLYQPMKDIGAKYPTWLEDHRDSLSSEDFQRFEEQHRYIQDIVELYERDPSNYTRLVELLQEMQQRGQPPQDIIDELAPGMSFGADGLPKLGGNDGSGIPDDCVMQ